MLRFNPRVLAGAIGLAYAAAWAQTPSAAKPAEPEKPGVAGTIGGESVSVADLDAKVAAAVIKKMAPQDLYDARRAAMDEIVLEKALGADAAKKGVTVEQLLKEQTTAKVTPVTDAEVQAYFDANKARMQNRTLEQVSAQIKNMLVSQRENQARTALVNELKAKAQAKFLLDVPRIEIAVAANDPAKGPPTAKVTILEFSEYQ